MLMYVMEGGPHYCEGSFQSLVDAFAAVIEDNGGEIVVSSPVTGISVEEGRATGVTTEAGDQLRAGTVISNADAMTTLEQMVGFEHLPERYVKRLRRMTPSLSGFWLFAGTTLDCSQFGLPHEIFIHHHWDHDRNFQDIQEGKPGGLWLSIPSLFDPSVAPEGEHAIVLTSHMPYDIGEPWSDAKPRYEELMVDEVERLIPGFRDNITHLESATPESFESWTGNYQGAIYGWEPTPNQSTPKRLPRITPIEGLLLSGHWTDPGSGAVRCIYSGVLTAQMMLGYENPPALLAGLSGGAQAPLASGEADG
jgi:prolycopene isomerase